MEALGKLPAKNEFDGKSILPLLTGEAKTHHDTLYWSKGPTDDWAVRRGDWKLHSQKGELELVNLADDPSETKNVAGDNADKVKELQAAYDKWIARMADPITGGPKRNDTAKNTEAKSEEKEMTEREKKRARIRAENKKQRAVEKKAKQARGKS